MAASTVIATSGLTKRYGATPALRDLDLQVRAGEVFGFLGPNGAGKTTTLRLLLGMLRPTRGSAQILGRDCWHDAVALHREVGYVAGEPALYDRLTGRQHMEYLARLRGERLPRRGLELAERLELDLGRRARELSKGNRQKLALVLGLMSAPPVLLLDEPTSGLDPLAQRTFHEMLREHTGGGGTVLLSSHVLAEVQQVADRIGVLRSGELVAVENLQEMRAKALHHVRATFADDVPTDLLAGVPGLRDVQLADRWLRCSAPQAALDALIKSVARHPVEDFECAEAGLEETFLTFYGGSAETPVAATAAPGSRRPAGPDGAERSAVGRRTLTAARLRRARGRRHRRTRAPEEVRRGG